MIPLPVEGKGTFPNRRIERGHQMIKEKLFAGIAVLASGMMFLLAGYVTL